MKRKVLAILMATAAVGIGQTGTALADGNSAGDSVGVVQVGAVSASPSATAPVAVTGSGNTAQDSVGAAQVGDGNTSTSSAGVAQVGGTSARPTASVRSGSTAAHVAVTA